MMMTYCLIGHLCITGDTTFRIKNHVVLTELHQDVCAFVFYSINNNTGQINGTDQKFYVQTPLTTFDITENTVRHLFCVYYMHRLG